MRNASLTIGIVWDLGLEKALAFTPSPPSSSYNIEHPHVAAQQQAYNRATGRAIKPGQFAPKDKPAEATAVAAPPAEPIGHNLPAITPATTEDLEAGNDAAKGAVGDASQHLLQEHVTGNKKLGLSWDKVKDVAGHVIENVIEKIDIRNTARELVKLGKEHGPVFMAYAIAIEAFEDIVVPAFLTAIHKPALIPFALAFHTEPVMYPLYFAVAKAIKKARGEKPNTFVYHKPIEKAIDPRDTATAGEGAKYVGEHPLKDIAVHLKHLEFSNKDGQVTPIHLEGEPIEKSIYGGDGPHAHKLYKVKDVLEAAGPLEKNHYIRWDHREFQPGDKTGESYHWKEGVGTGRKMAGTSALSPHDRLSSGAMQAAYYGQPYVVTGRRSHRGHDEGEVVLKDARVVRKIDVGHLPENPYKPVEKSVVLLFDIPIFKAINRHDRGTIGLNFDEPTRTPRATRSHSPPGRTSTSDEHWITVNGHHILLDRRGSPVGGGAFADVVAARLTRKPAGGGDTNMTPRAAGQLSAREWQGKHLASEEERTALKVPPGYAHVHVPDDPNHKMAWTGVDVKGRSKRVYKAAAESETAVAKFARIKKLDRAIDGIMRKNDSNLKSGTNQEEAAVIRLIYAMAFRPGGEADTQADVKSFGATTLLKSHVSVDGDTIHFQFTGKSAHEQDKYLTDPVLAQIINRKLNEQGERLFDTTDSKVRAYFHALHPGAFHPKDLRTWAGTALAIKTIAAMSVPANAKERKAAVKQVATVVSEHLGNTPAVALSRYIDPAVFKLWEE